MSGKKRELYRNSGPARNSGLAQRALALLLSLVLAFGMLTAQAFAVEGNGSGQSGVSAETGSDAAQDEAAQGDATPGDELAAPEDGNAGDEGDKAGEGDAGTDVPANEADPSTDEDEATLETPADEVAAPDAESSELEALIEKTAEAVKPSLSYRAHSEYHGWQPPVTTGKTAGTTGKSLRLEALNITLNKAAYTDSSIIYSAHVAAIGWQKEVKDGAQIGTTGRSLAIEAVTIKLSGKIAADYDIYYRLHCQEFGWLSWAKNGAVAGTSSLSRRSEAIEIKLVGKGEAADPANPAPTDLARPSFTPALKAQAHVAGTGWQRTQSGNSLVLGTTGQARRLEAVKLNNAAEYTGGINYTAHVAAIGWQAAVKDGALAGTTGRSLAIEALKITLSGQMAKNYDIYYRAHVASVGWLGWAKNGIVSGSTGCSLAMEAIQVTLLPKGSAPPGSTANPYINIPPSKIINAPAIRQLPELPTGCEITAVAIMLNGYGVAANKVTLAHQMPYSNNPNQGYVGNPFTTGGWTIYPPALVGTISRYTGSATILTGASHNTLVRTLASGKPVVVWMTMHGFGVHAICLTGYDAYNFYYNDPWTGGKNIQISRSAFDRNWATQARRAITC